MGARGHRGERLFGKYGKSDGMPSNPDPLRGVACQPSSPVSPRSRSTSEPALPSKSPLKHSRVSAAARLISSSRIQWPFFTAWANVPYRPIRREYKAVKGRSYTPLGSFRQNGGAPRALPPQRQRSWLSHKLGSAAESGSAWRQVPPTLPGARQLQKCAGNISHSIVLLSHYPVITGYPFKHTTVGLLLQLFSQSRLADMVHEFEQILPTLSPEAGLHMPQESQVLLPWVGLREKVFKGLPQREQYLLMVNWLVPTLERNEDDSHNGYSVMRETLGPGIQVDVLWSIRPPLFQAK